jgi:hypothetical protein
MKPKNRNNKPQKPPAPPSQTLPFQDSADEHSITAFGSGVFHLGSKFRIPIKFSITSEDGVAPDVFEVTSDSEILVLEWVKGGFDEGFVHVEICGVHFITGVIAHMKSNAALLLHAAPFYRALAQETAYQPRPWRSFW